MKSGGRRAGFELQQEGSRRSRAHVDIRGEEGRAENRGICFLFREALKNMHAVHRITRLGHNDSVLNNRSNEYGRESIMASMARAAISLGIGMTVAAGGSGLFAGAASAQDVLRLIHNVSNETTWHAGAERFAELVAERTDGEFEIRIHP